MRQRATVISLFDKLTPCGIFDFAGSFKVEPTGEYKLSDTDPYLLGVFTSDHPETAKEVERVIECSGIEHAENWTGDTDSSLLYMVRNKTRFTKDKGAILVLYANKGVPIFMCGVEFHEQNPSIAICCIRALSTPQRKTLGDYPLSDVVLAYQRHWAKVRGCKKIWITFDPRNDWLFRRIQTGRINSLQYEIGNTLRSMKPLKEMQRVRNIEQHVLELSI